MGLSLVLHNRAIHEAYMKHGYTLKEIADLLRMHCNPERNSQGAGRNITIQQAVEKQPDKT